MEHRAAGGLQRAGYVDLGNGHPRLDAGGGQDVAAWPDDLGVGDEAQLAERAVLVGGQPDDLVLQGPGGVEEVEPLGPAVLGDGVAGRGPGGGPGRDAGDHLGAVDGEAPSRLGEGLVVADQGAHAAGWRVHAAELAAGGVEHRLAQRLVDLAVQPEDAVARDDGRGVVALAAVRLAESDDHGHVAGECRDTAHLGPVDVHDGRQVLGLLVVAAVAAGAEYRQVAAEAGLGQGEQADALGAGLLDEVGDLGEVLVDVAAEAGADGGDGSAEGWVHQGHEAVPNPVTVCVMASVTVPSGQRSPTPVPGTSSPQTAVVRWSGRSPA